MPSSSFNLLRWHFLPGTEVLSFAHGHNESHVMALVGGVLSPLSCPRSHVRLMYQSPRDSLALWLEQPTVNHSYGGLHHRMNTHLFSHTPADTDLNSKGDAAVTRASVRLCPQLCFLMLSLSLSSHPFPLNTARSQTYFLISLFSLSCDSRMKLPSSSTLPFFP